jgi:hypothetical protein
MTTKVAAAVALLHGREIVRIADVTTDVAVTTTTAAAASRATVVPEALPRGTSLLSNKLLPLALRAVTEPTQAIQATERLLVWVRPLARRVLLAWQHLRDSLAVLTL